MSTSQDSTQDSPESPLTGEPDRRFTRSSSSAEEGRSPGPSHIPPPSSCLTVEEKPGLSELDVSKRVTAVDSAVSGEVERMNRGRGKTRRPAKSYSRVSPCERDVALFVDWENMKGSLAKTGTEPDAASLRDLAGQFGRVVIANAYADWQDPWHQDDPFRLYAAGVQPVYVPSVIHHGEGGAGVALRARRRNSVDVKVTADCIECCFKYPDIWTYVLASGDGDFVHLVHTLRPYGKIVVAVGVFWSTSGLLAESVDKLIYYDRDVEPIHFPDECAGGMAYSEEKEELIRASLERVLETISSSQRKDRAVLAWVKHELSKRHGAIEEGSWGFSSFKSLIREAERRGLLRVVEIDLVNWALLPEAAFEGEEHSKGRSPEQNGPLASFRQRLIQFAHALEVRHPYVSFTFLLDHLLEAAVFSYSREELADLVNDAVEELIFLRSSVQDNRGGAVRTIRTIILNQNHPDVKKALGEGRRSGPLVSVALHPRSKKPGGDSHLLEDLRTLAREPDNHVLEYRIGEHLCQLGRHREALDHFRHALSLSPEHLTYYRATLSCLEAVQAYEEAIVLGKAALDHFPDDAELHFLFGKLLRMSGDVEEALGEMSKAESLLPPDSEDWERLYLEMACLYRQLGQPDKAGRALEAGLLRNPESKRLQNELARRQEDVSRTEAERLGRRAASLVSQIGREDEVIELAQGALSLCNGIYQPYYALGEIYMRREDFEKAVECFEKAIPLCSSPGAVSSMRMRLTNLYERLGRSETAQRDSFHLA